MHMHLSYRALKRRICGLCSVTFTYISHTLTLSHSHLWLRKLLRHLPALVSSSIKMEITILLQYRKCRAYSRCSTNFTSFLPRWVLGSAQPKLLATHPSLLPPVGPPHTWSPALALWGEDAELHGLLSPCGQTGRGRTAGGPDTVKECTSGHQKT